MNEGKHKVLGFLPLLAMVVGAIIGSGIFNSPADLGRLANPGWIFLAWMITGIGSFSLAKTFHYLAEKRPDLEGGIYTYGREAAGEFAGFNSAYGYWWSAIFTNLAYLFAIPKILSRYLPVLGQDKWASFLLASALLWGYFFLIRAGIKTAGIANVIITAFKIMPLIFVVGVTIFMFKPSLVQAPFSSTLIATGQSAGAWQQIGGCFGVMVFAFLGSEAAVVISGRAKKPGLVGPATLFGFIITLAIYVLVSTLSLAVAPAKEIIRSPSPLGEVLGYAIGNFGRLFLDFGFLFSVSGALLCWLLLTAETPYIPAVRDNAFPRAFARTNRQAVPIFSLAVTCLITQAILFILAAFSVSPDIGAGGNASVLQDLYFAAINMAVICCLVAYLFSALLCFKQANREKATAPKVYAVLTGIFFSWVIIATTRYAIPAAFIYWTGMIFRYRVHRQRRENLPDTEVIFYDALSLCIIILSLLIATGRIKL